MKAEINEKPREFGVGEYRISDYGRISFQAGEMVTLVSPGGRGCDVTAREWGFYLAPSLNARLRDQGFKVGLVRNSQGKLFLNAVEIDKLDIYLEYLNHNEGSVVIQWLDELVEGPVVCAD